MHGRWFPLAVLLLALASGGSAFAGAGGHPNAPGHNKLPAPQGLTCLLVGTTSLSVSWTQVAGAASYQVLFEGTMPPGTAVEHSLYVKAPPVAVPVVSGTSGGAQVRALPPPKKPDHPPQGAGPKGDWSEACPVEVP
jgi:hypothetical protein